MKMYVARIPGEVLKIKSRASYYARQKHLFVVVVIMVSVVPVLVIRWTSSHYYQASWLRKTSADLKSLADSRKEIITLFLQSQENLLAGYCELYDLKALGVPSEFERLFAAINRTGIITDLGVIDFHGNHVAYVGPYKKQLADKNYSQTEWFREVIQNGRYISDLFTGYRGVPHFVVAVTSPVKTWMLRATINSELFQALLDSTEVGPGGDAFIINKKGELQTSSRLGLISIPPEDLSAFVNANKTDVYRQGGFLCATARMKGGDWILVLKTDINTSLAEYYRARNRDILIILCSSLMILVVATILVRSMVGKLENADHQRMSLNDRIRQAEKMALVGRLAASVAHEINNPLQIIGDQAGWIDELLEEDRARIKNPDEYRHATGKIRVHVKRASSITHRLLGFARTNLGEKISADINCLVGDSVSFVENEARNRQITIRRDLDQGLPKITTDAAQLQQVFLNVLNNAIDAIDHDGVITISTRNDGNRIIIEFADSGPGIPAEELERLFDPFFTTKKVGRGTGLGLSLSHNIMQRLGGDIRPRNGKQGGSIFTITLPS